MRNKFELDTFLKEQIEILNKGHIDVDIRWFKPRNDRYFKYDLFKYLDKCIKENIENLFFLGNILKFSECPSRLSDLIVKVIRKNDGYVYKRISDIKNLSGVIIHIEQGSHVNYLVKMDNGCWFRISLISGNSHYDIEVSKETDIPGRYTAKDLAEIISDALYPITQHDFGHDETMNVNQYYQNLIDCLIPNATKYEQVYNSYNFNGECPIWVERLYPEPSSIYASWGEYYMNFRNGYLRRDYVRQLKNCIIYNLKYHLSDFTLFPVIINDVEIIDFTGRTLFENAISEIEKI